MAKKAPGASGLSLGEVQKLEAWRVKLAPMTTHLHLFGAREADRIAAIDDRIRRRLEPDTVEQLDAEAQRVFDLYGTVPEDHKRTAEKQARKQLADEALALDAKRRRERAFAERNGFAHVQAVDEALGAK